LRPVPASASDITQRRAQLRACAILQQISERTGSAYRRRDLTCAHGSEHQNGDFGKTRVNLADELHPRAASEELQLGDHYCRMQGRDELQGFIPPTGLAHHRVLALPCEQGRQRLPEKTLTVNEYHPSAAKLR
jgi:hypothetical protein